MKSIIRKCLCFGILPIAILGLNSCDFISSKTTSTPKITTTTSATKATPKAQSFKITMICKDSSLKINRTSSVTVKNGETWTPTSPNISNVSDATFVGWYYDEALTKQVTGTITPTQDMTIYGKFASNAPTYRDSKIDPTQTTLFIVKEVNDEIIVTKGCDNSYIVTDYDYFKDCYFSYDNFKGQKNVSFSLPYEDGIYTATSTIFYSGQLVDGMFSFQYSDRKYKYSVQSEEKTIEFTNESNSKVKKKINVKMTNDTSLEYMHSYKATIKTIYSFSDGINVFTITKTFEGVHKGKPASYQKTDDVTGIKINCNYTIPKIRFKNKFEIEKKKYDLKNDDNTCEIVGSISGTINLLTFILRMS